MAKIYKIHPAIGIARVGGSASSFFLAPEKAEGTPSELNDATETPLTSFKDSAKLIKRQGVRFRVFEYEQTAGGALSHEKEITAELAQIEWKVEVVNRKAAGAKIAGAGGQRNPTISDRTSLVIAPGALTTRGASQAPKEFSAGKFQNKSVFLGDMRTDAEGRLIFCGGRGVSASVPAGKPIISFANNDFWHDDVSDGPVTATVSFPGQPPKTVDSPAWVICAPPDFGPEIRGVVTMYDVAFQAAVTRGFLNAPTSISFLKDVFPILRRATILRWVNQFPVWNSLSRDWPTLSNKAAAGSADRRKAIHDFLIDPPLNQLLLTAVQKDTLKKWRDGDFIDDFSPAPPPAPGLTAAGLDREALEACVGGGFFPGIEGPSILTNPALYSEAFRLSHTAVKAGGITELMALPWQADFLKCAGSWWPSQRPDEVFINPTDPAPGPLWQGGIQNHVHLVANINRLGFVVGAGPDSVGEPRFVEKERDPTFPRV